jgi:hypothetical protein
MSTCDLGFDHPDPEPEVIIEEAPDTEPIAEASVEVAKIEADRDVAVAKIANRGMDEDTAALIAGMQARIEVLEAANMPAEPEPVVIPMPAEEPEPEPAPAPEEHPEHATPQPERKKGFF